MKPIKAVNGVARAFLCTWMRTLLKLVLLGGLVLSLGSAWQAALADSPAFYPPNAPACNPADLKQARLNVDVIGMRNTKGVITVTIYPDQPAHFLDGKYKVARQTFPVTAPDTHFCFVLPAPGNYAVALFHDENANGHYDTNFLGLPVEGAGFSKNPTLFVGPPRLSQVLIPVHQGDNAVSVKLKYY